MDKIEICQIENKGVEFKKRLHLLVLFFLHFINAFKMQTCQYEKWFKRTIAVNKAMCCSYF